MEQGLAIPPPKPSPFDIPKCCPRSAFPLARREKEGRLRSRAELFVLTDQLTRADVRPAQGGAGARAGHAPLQAGHVLSRPHGNATGLDGPERQRLSPGVARLHWDK